MRLLAVGTVVMKYRATTQQAHHQLFNKLLLIDNVVNFDALLLSLYVKMNIELLAH